MNRKRNGFTTVELVIVIAVIAILATVLIPTFSGLVGKANDSKALQEAKNAYTEYLIENGGTAPEYMLYQSGNRFVALHNGAPVALYADKITAINDMFGTNGYKYYAKQTTQRNLWQIKGITPKQLVNGYSEINREPTDCQSQGMPFVYADQDFANCVIDKVSLYVTGRECMANTTGTALVADKEYTFDLVVIGVDSLKANGTYDMRRTYTIKVLGKDVTNGWMTFDVSNLGIKLGADETLGFGSASTTLGTAYEANSGENMLNYWGKTGGLLSKRPTNNLLVGVEGYESSEEVMLREILRGKYLSVFGASMCTYNGYSNDTTNNNTIGNNAQYYGMPGSGCPNTSLTVDDTFWKQLIDQLGMELLVNNSWSGSRILDNRANAAGYNERPTQLHANTGPLNGTKPDVIVSFMGNNDYGDSSIVVGSTNDALYVSVDSYINEGRTDKPSTFAEGYALMIAKMVKTYPNAKIFLFNMRVSGDKTLQDAEKYNAVINAIADHYGCYVVDLTHSIMSGKNFSNYAFDAMHPNAAGMDVWTDLVIDAMKKCYLS